MTGRAARGGTGRVVAPEMPTGTLAVKAPPELPPSGPGTSALTSMLPMIGSLGSVVMIAVMRPGRTGFLIGGMFLLSSLGFVLVNGWRQRSQRAAELTRHRREYLGYLATVRADVRSAAAQQRQAACWRFPDPATLVFLAEDRARVWERNPADDDFLQVRVGVADQPSSLVLRPPERVSFARADPVCAAAAHRFVATHETQPDLPVSVDLRQRRRIEVVGDPDRARALARAMVVGVATVHHPENLVVAVVAAPDAVVGWEWVKWLPHAHSRRERDGAGPVRMVVGAAADLVSLLPAELAARSRPSGPATCTPHVLVVCDGVPQPSDPVFAVDGVTVLDLPRHRPAGEPDGSTLRIDLRPGAGPRPGVGPRGRDAHLVDADGTQAITADGCAPVEAEATARRLMPLYNGPAAVPAGPAATAQADLTDLLGLPDVRDVDVDLTWRPRLVRDRLRVPLGQDEHGAPVVLDLKESAEQGMGPHGVLIGATGSGKSEVLRTLVLALALTHAPEQLNFVLVDFKGGATFAGMADLPHVSAIITNLGREASLVDRFQDALTGEVTRRQELLRAAGNFASVSDYEEARREGRTDLDPLPALLVVVDEFSELLAARPEFVDSFVNIGRVGRSLQVHLLFASQRLEEGKLRGLDTYLSYRIGLRTFSAAESRAVLGADDAFRLPSEPGVGYLKTGTEEMTRFKAAYVSGRLAPRMVAAPVTTEPGRTAAARVERFTAAPVPLLDERQPDLPPPVLEQAPEGTMFEVAVAAMVGRGTQAHPVWLPPLERPEPLDVLLGDLVVDPRLGLTSPGWRAAGPLRVPVGMVDVPLEQRREPLVVDLTGTGGHLGVVGAPLSGKSTLLRTVVCALALTATPTEVQFYVLDFGGGSFVGLRDLPHLAGLASRSEPDVVRRTVAEVSSVVASRETYFRAHGIDSMDTYRQRRARGEVDDGWGDVFLVVDGWTTLRKDFETLETVVAGIVAQGLTYGVHVLLSATRWLDVRGQVKDLLGTKLELRLGDPGDTVGNRRIAGNVPTAVPGRGLNPVSGLHTMAALPRVDGSDDAATLADGVADLVDQVRAAAAGPEGPKLRMLPERIDLDQVRALAPPDDRRILLGIDEDSLAPFGIDPVAEPHLLLFGESGSGRSSMLRAFVREVQRVYQPPRQALFFVVDYRRALLDEIPPEHQLAYFTSHEMTVGGMAELAGLFNSRIPGPDVTAEQLRNRSWWKGADGFVIVDDYDLVVTSQGNPLEKLVPLLAQASDLGLHLVITRHSGGASRAMYDKVLQRLTDLGTTGILLSGSPNEGPILGRVKPVQSVPGRAQVVSRDRGLFTGQLAWVPPRHE
ncbi:MAG: type VII secretion protein EccCa [Micrococcales bacterium]|nr:type VII secretion protein EccCa [Micrococcales bacterium]